MDELGLEPSEELRLASDGLERALVRAQVTARRLLLPDASVTSRIKKLREESVPLPE